MKNLKYIFFTTLFFISFTGLFAAEQEGIQIPSLSLHIKITEMLESQAPFIIGENLIFTYKPSKKRVRHVGISFGNENYSKIHNLYKNENGIYFFIYKYPKEEKIEYKYIEDGVWITDKKAQMNFIDNNFISLSSFKIPEKNIKEHISPIINGSSATFTIKAEPESSIYLTGDFNSWNPFLYKLNEEKPGLFSITIRLPEGQYGYYYILNGERTLDIENPIKGRSNIGEKVSLCTIE
ncbi:MAG: hypothetical protein OCD02_02465 [Spirochaetaceae bacterium]